MPALRIGRPLPGNFSDDAWSCMAVFDLRQVLWSFVVGGIVTGCITVLWCWVDNASLPLDSQSPDAIFLLTLAMVICHEALHLLAFPGAGLNANTVIGIWPQLASPYVQYISPMRRNRFLFACILPFLILSILPLILVLAGFEPISYLSWISVGNSVGASSDLFIVGKVLLTVPAGAMVLESDGKVYWTSH